MENQPPALDELRQLEREFYKIDEDVIERMRRNKPRLLRYATAALETIFDHLDSHPLVADYFSDEANIAPLKSAMLAHCNTVLSVRFDLEYYSEASQIGLRHSKLDYPSFVYSAAYTNMLSSMKAQALRDRNPLKAADLEALDRIAFYDLELTQAAFFQHKIEKATALNADTAKVRALLDDEADAA
ncbi:MAG: hypothetical protein GYB36_04515 [Alphaproteobacteria bacterium]|nr:hypothetical protein [Alphaproteobacteria bacterium]